MNWTSSHQHLILDQLENKLQIHQKLPIVVSETLGLSVSNTYKKLNGSSLFNLDQVILLCRKFNISFDALFLSKDENNIAYPFYSHNLVYHPKTIAEYWQNINNHLNNLVFLENLDATYLANEIPFFYYLQFPYLFCFKTFIWNKISWKIDLHNNKYDPEPYLNNQDLRCSVSEITNIYNNFPSTEIWNPEMLRLTFMQLKYCIAARSFNNKEDIFNILKDLEKLILHMKAQAISGKKQIFGKKATDIELTIHLNQLSINSEMILIEAKDFSILYNKYDSPNYLRSQDDRVCSHMRIWLDDLIVQSTLISRQGQRDRDAFFEDMLASLDRFTIRVNSLINAYD